MVEFIAPWLDLAGNLAVSRMNGRTQLTAKVRNFAVRGQVGRRKEDRSNFYSGTISIQRPRKPCGLGRFCCHVPSNLQAFCSCPEPRKLILGYSRAPAFNLNQHNRQLIGKAVVALDCDEIDDAFVFETRPNAKSSNRSIAGAPFKPFNSIPRAVQAIQTSHAPLRSPVAIFL
jgi:hypothetical protein